MTTTINGITIPSVENISLSNSKDFDEIDLVNEDTNFVLGGSEQIKEIEIEANLVKELHPDSLSVEDQRDEVEKLIDKDVQLNDTLIDSNSGYIFVDDVSIPEKSESDTIREATITGSFLPWPKNLERFVETDLIEIEGSTLNSFNLFSEQAYGFNYSGTYAEGSTENPYISFIRGLESSLSATSSLSGSLDFVSTTDYSGDYGSDYSSPSDSVSYGTDYETDYGIT